MYGALPPRLVTLVLVNEAGNVVGELPPFSVETPWWMDMVPVVQQAEARFGLRPVILRLLATELPEAHGGAVTYLAQIRGGSSSRLPLRPSTRSLTDDPKRASYARVGGPTADLEWAVKALEGDGDALTGEPVQHRTWNLSSVWSIPSRSGFAWLKVVPPFFAHEGRMIEVLGDALRGSNVGVPVVIARDGPRMLLRHLDGTDRYDAPRAERLRMIDAIVELQHELCPRVTELLANGVPDWRAPALVELFRGLIERRSPDVDASSQRSLHEFIDGLNARFALLNECGIPDTIVHGDYHPGNVRGDGNSLAIIDWGDSGIGHPLLDEPAFFRDAADVDVDAMKTHWAKTWRRAIPDCEPDRAARLLAPVAAARQALVYQTFLDQIEESEQVYHRNDVPTWLTRTAELVANEPPL